MVSFEAKRGLESMAQSPNIMTFDHFGSVEQSWKENKGITMAPSLQIKDKLSNKIRNPEFEFF